MEVKIVKVDDIYFVRLTSDECYSEDLSPMQATLLSRAVEEAAAGARAASDVVQQR